ncbi:hypothetical protein [Metallosphaera javensis (ex Sakai et al. 2022)]|uniref:hypothetical protein n=1 Tax=Metallosphaera javensis (ex Sakai et al. 2022) TaxID=2775498 RepID=UPI0025827E63|nr:MAG: hypothetical protein MjAS7_0827 [Metallosphaera javensis (ex Sakai et al. 2022)]
MAHSEKEEPFYQFFFPLYVKQFNQEISAKFLKQGFKDEGKEYEEEAIIEAVKELDGIPAWLNYFGLKSLSCNKIDLQCINKVLNEIYQDPVIKSIIDNEYKKLGKNAKEILKFLAKKGGKGNLRGINLGKSSINEGLKSLLNDGYIVREERGTYEIIDPIISKILPDIS